jgi:hypothetical protein
MEKLFPESNEAFRQQKRQEEVWEYLLVAKLTHVFMSNSAIFAVTVKCYKQSSSCPLQ